MHDPHDLLSNRYVDSDSNYYHIESNDPMFLEIESLAAKLLLVHLTDILVGPSNEKPFQDFGVNQKSLLKH